MSAVKETETHPEKRLWKELKDSRAGMLGIEGSHSHMQPMAHICDEENGRLWFFTSRNSDLFRELTPGAHAHFCLIGKHQDYHACLLGALNENVDRGKIDELWTDMAGAWFTGKDDPDLILLEFDLMDAAIWASTRNPVKYVREVERAKDNERTPDVGVRAHVEFTEGQANREESGKRI